jgi:hypothetical protein
MGARSPVWKSTEEYCLTIAAAVATKALKIRLGLAGEVSYGNNIYDIGLHAEGDGRICNKVYIMLKEKGVLATFNYNQPTHYSFSSSRKERKSYYGTVSEEWFKANAPLIAKAPVFNTSGRIAVKEYSYSTETKNKLVKETDNYRKLFGYGLFGYGSFEDAEDIYIYLHFDEYDIQKRDEEASSSYRSHRNRYGSNSKTTYHVIYPKALLNKLSEGVFHSHAMDYVDKHLEWVMANVLGITDDKVINKIELSKLNRPSLIIQDAKYWTAEHIDKQLQYIAKYQSMLSIGKKSLLRLKAVVEKFGGWEELHKQAQISFIKYLEENFPLHLSEDEVDKDLKELCEWVQLGKNRGFNERAEQIQLRKKE